MTREAFSIKAFCQAHGISRSMYYKLRRAGKGPIEMRVCSCVRISREAAEAWRRKLEAEAQTDQPPAS